MQGGTTSKSARDVIVPVPLVKGPPVPAAPWWEATWVMPSAIGAAVLVVVAFALVVRSMRRRRLPAHERGYRVLAKRLRLTSREQVLLRDLSTRVETPSSEQLRNQAEPARRATGATLPAASIRRIEDVVEFIGKVRPDVGAARAASPSGRGAPIADDASPSLALMEVKPVSLLLSERAFLSAANRWLREPGRRESDRQRLVAMQTKIFASSR